MVQIITDSSTLYTVEEALQRGFEAVPLCISIGDFEGRDLQIDMDAYYVAHARALEDAMKAKEMLSEAFAGAEIQILELSPVFVAQGGPRCVAIQYIER